MPKKAKAKKTAGARKSPGVAKKKARAGKATARKTANRKTTRKKAPRAESVNRAAEARRKRSLEAVGLYEKALKALQRRENVDGLGSVSAGHRRLSSGA